MVHHRKLHLKYLHSKIYNDYCELCFASLIIYIHKFANSTWPPSWPGICAITESEKIFNSVHYPGFKCSKSFLVKQNLIGFSKSSDLFEVYRLIAVVHLDDQVTANVLFPRSLLRLNLNPLSLLSGSGELAEQDPAREHALPILRQLVGQSDLNVFCSIGAAPFPVDNHRLPHRHSHVLSIVDGKPRSWFSTFCVAHIAHTGPELVRSVVFSVDALFSKERRVFGGQDRLFGVQLLLTWVDHFVKLQVNVQLYIVHRLLCENFTHTTHHPELSYSEAL